LYVRHAAPVDCHCRQLLVVLINRKIINTQHRWRILPGAVCSSDIFPKCASVALFSVGRQRPFHVTAVTRGLEIFAGCLRAPVGVESVATAPRLRPSSAPFQVDWRFVTTAPRRAATHRNIPDANRRRLIITYTTGEWDERTDRRTDGASAPRVQVVWAETSAVVDEDFANGRRLILIAAAIVHRPLLMLQCRPITSLS